MIGSDVNFPTNPGAYGLEGKITEDRLISIRSTYLEYAYRAMARFSRGSILIQDAKVITKEMVNSALLGKRP